MRRSLAILPALAVGFAMPAFAQDSATAAAKKACETFNTLEDTGDAAKLVNNFYTETAVFIGPMPVAGILIGREAIQKCYGEAHKTFKAFIHKCENATALNESTAVVSGTWFGTPKDSNGSPIKGIFGMTFVKEGGKWLAAMNSWNIDPPPSSRNSAIGENAWDLLQAQDVDEPKHRGAKRWFGRR